MSDLVTPEMECAAYDAYRYDDPQRFKKMIAAVAPLIRAAALEEVAKLCGQCADVFEANNEDSEARYPLEYASRMLRSLATQEAK